MNKKFLVIIGLITLLILTLTVTSCTSSGPKPKPQEESLKGFTLSLPGSTMVNKPFGLTVKAEGSEGSSPFTEFSGKVSLVASQGTITPSTIDLQNGEGTANVSITNTKGVVTITASAGGKNGNKDITVNVPERLIEIPGKNEPVEVKIPDIPFEPTLESYSDDHPDLEGIYISHNTLIIAFNLGTKVSEANAILAEVGAEIVGGLPGAENEAEGILFIQLPTQNHTELAEAIKTLEDNSQVKHVVQDVLLNGEMVPDSNGGSPSGWTWQLNPSGGNWGMELIGAPQMWNLNGAIAKVGNTTDTGVLDVGFANSHNDLNYSSISSSIQHSHGTHVAGTIGANFSNHIGVDGLTPFANLHVRALGSISAVPGPNGWFKSAGQVMIFDFFKLLNSNPNIKVVNISLGYNWASNANIDSDTSLVAQNIAKQHGALFGLAEIIRVIFGGKLPVIVAAAGNDSNDGFGTQDARYSSPFTSAALNFNIANIIVVESLANSPSSTGGATRSGFSNINGHISAPGSSVLSTVLNNNYGTKSGTSMAAPHVTGLISYLYSLDPSLPRPTLTTNPILSLLQANDVPVAGGASNRINAFATALDVDRVNNNTLVLKKLLDIDDGTPDGNQRILIPPTGADFTGEDADGDGGIGDGDVNMSDFRRWRDWLLQVENSSALSLDGAANHPKKDVNGNGAVGSASTENIYPQGDFNGDGRLSRTATNRVPGAVNSTVTDLQVLQRIFNDSNYSASDLPHLINSADIEVWPRNCLNRPDVTSVRSYIIYEGNDLPSQIRTHNSSQPRQVYTVPIAKKGHLVGIEALDNANNIVFETTKTFPFTLGSDAFWNPECEGTSPKDHGRSWGDPHIITFAGLAYEFQAVGEFVFLESNSKDLTVQVCETPWGNSGRVSVNRAVATIVSGKRVNVDVTQGTPVSVDGVTQSIADGGTLAVGTGQIQRSGTTYKIIYPSGDELHLKLYGAGYINIDMYIDASRKGKVAGLLGNANDITSDDIALRNGTVLTQPLSFADLYTTYANSWRTQPVESLFDSGFQCPANTNYPVAYTTSNDLDPQVKQAAEAACQQAGVTDPHLLEACIVDVGLTKNVTFAEGAADTTPPQEVLVVKTELPNPILKYVGSEEYSANGKQFIRYKLAVENWQDYPDALFVASPNLPPCGNNNNSSRTWVDIFNSANGDRIYGFCALGKSENLQNLWFAVEKCQIPPALVHIKLIDRLLNKEYPSNRVKIPEQDCDGHKIVIVHGRATSVMLEYKTGLEKLGFSVDNLDVSNVNQELLSQYDAILIDSLSGSLSEWQGNEDVISAILNVEKPVLGLGEGGYAFLGKFGSPIGYGNGWHATRTSFEVVTPKHDSLVGPRAVVETRGQVKVSNVAMGAVEINMPKPTSDIKLVGRSVSDDDHYPVITQSDFYALWGFHGSPASYTDSGWNALANLIDALID